MSRRLIAGVLSLCLLALSHAANAETLLQAKFKKGETQKQKMIQKQTMSMVLPGQPKIDTTQIQTMSMSMEVICDDVADSGIATLRHRLPRMQMSMQLPGAANKKLEYDTDEPVPTDPILQQIDKMLRPMIGVDFSMKCNAQGKISDFVIPPKALDGIKGSPAAALGGDMFSESGMKQRSEQGGVVLPEKAVKIGDKWTTKTEIKSPIGVMKMDREHTYLGPDSKTGLEKIGIAVKVTLQPDPNSKLPAKVELKSGSGEGEVLFDNKLGRVARSQIKMTMDMEITAGTQTIQQNIISDGSIEDVTSEK